MAKNADSEATQSLWMSQTEVMPGAKPLRGSTACDVAIVGSGIAGLSVAYELATAGRTVVVLDRGPISGGITARTTAHLAPICDDGVSTLIKMRGEATAKLFQQSQAAGVDRIEEIINAEKISCSFRRLDAFLFPAPGMDFKDAREQQQEELKALRKVGAEAEQTRGVPFVGFEEAPVIRYANQATFHPLKYLAGLCDAIKARGGKFYANSVVTEVQEQGEGVSISLESGHTVEAGAAVVATNSPINDRVALHSKMAPYRTYAMAFTVPRGTLPDALYWDMADPYHYIRLQHGPGTVDYLIVGGRDHKSGEANDGAVRFETLTAWIGARVPNIGKEVARWSGQVMDTVDYCGFIGINPGNKRTYVATGDSGQGMTHGALAGILIKDLITTGSSPWQDVYEPSRVPLKGTLNYVRENATAITNYAEYLLPAEIGSVDDIAPGEGGVMRDGLKRVAVSRDNSGKLHACSAVCTHLGCHVHWNSTEKCWDCPCHGSQFAPNGEVLAGPATAPLEVAEVPRSDVKR